MIAFKPCWPDRDAFVSYQARGAWQETYRLGERMVPSHDGTRIMCVATIAEALENFRRASILEVDIPDDSALMIMGLCTDQRQWSVNWERVLRTQMFGYLIGEPWFHERREGDWTRIMWHRFNMDTTAVKRRWILAECCDVLRVVA